MPVWTISIGTENHFLTSPISILGSEAFSPLAQLKHVDISGCSKLASVEAHAFKSCLDLKHVTISLNRALVYIDPRAFDSGMSKLRSLNLADNGLQSLPATLVPWPRLHSLDLSNNPWHCDCSLSFAAEMLAQFQPNVSDKIMPGKCASPEAKRGSSLRDLQVDSCNNQYYQENQVVLTKEEAGVEDGKNDLNEARNEVKNAFMERHEQTNATAVIVSVSIVSVVIVLTLLTFIYLKWCRRHVQDWIKEYKWRRHDAALARKTNLSQPYLSGDNYIYTSPRLHHTYVYHGTLAAAATPGGLQPGQHQFIPQQQSPLVNNYPALNELANTTDAEDEYFYVSNYGGQNTASNIIIANGFGTVGKSIPVTVL